MTVAPPTQQLNESFISLKLTQTVMPLLVLVTKCICYGKNTATWIYGERRSKKSAETADAAVTQVNHKGTAVLRTFSFWRKLQVQLRVSLLWKWFHLHSNTADLTIEINAHETAAYWKYCPHSRKTSWSLSASIARGQISKDWSKCSSSSNDRPGNTDHIKKNCILPAFFSFLVHFQNVLLFYTWTGWCHTPLLEYEYYYYWCLHVWWSIEKVRKSFTLCLCGSTESINLHWCLELIEEE